MECLILMATYNGEKFIREQIQSIIEQSYKNWTLLIRDDGSTDKTVEIINRMRSKDNRITLIQNTTNEHGAYKNFWYLLHYTKTLKKFDYYFFADQDDIWNKDKLKRMICFDESFSSNTPRLVYSDMQIIDADGNLILESLNNVMGIGNISGLSLFFTHGYLWGCDVMINKALFDHVPLLEIDNSYIDIMSHDNYYGKFAMLIGDIKFLPTACICHRRHNNNETGSYQMNLNFFSALRRAIQGWDDLAKTHARVYKQTLVTINEIEKLNVSRKVLNDIRECILCGGIKGAKILWKYKVSRKQKLRTIGIYLVLLCKTYKKYL